MALSLTGLDPLTALSGAGSAVSNVGPGLGSIIGPAGTYETLNDAAKWILAATMLVGRLEIFSVLVLLSPPSGGAESDHYAARLGNIAFIVSASASCLKSNFAFSAFARSAAGRSLMRSNRRFTFGRSFHASSPMM